MNVLQIFRTLREEQFYIPITIFLLLSCLYSLVPVSLYLHCLPEPFALSLHFNMNSLGFNQFSCAFPVEKLVELGLPKRLAKWYLYNVT